VGRLHRPMQYVVLRRKLIFMLHSRLHIRNSRNLLNGTTLNEVARRRNGQSVGLAINRSRVQILLGATLESFGATLGKLFTPRPMCL